jgi:hypothetical protein
MSRRHILSIIGFVMLAVAADRITATLLHAGFREIEVGQTGGMVNRVLSTRADVIVLGSSRAWRHFDSTVLIDVLGRSVFNAGCDGQGIPYMRGILDLMLDRHTPELVIINVDANMLADRARHMGRLPVLAPFMDESDVIRDMIYARARFERLKYLSRSYRYNGKVPAILLNRGRSDPSVHGFVPVDGRMSPWVPVEDDRPLPELPHADPYLTELFQAMIRQAREAGSHVVLVTGPRWTHDGRVNPDRRRLMAEAGRIAREEGVPYFELTTETFPVFTDAALYVNPSHLNREGAALFSRQLGSILREWLEGHSRTPGRPRYIDGRAQGRARAPRRFGRASWMDDPDGI